MLLTHRFLPALLYKDVPGVSAADRRRETIRHRTKEVHKEEGKKKGGAIALKFGQPKRAGWAHAGDERALGIPGRAAATLRCTANP